MNSSYPVMLPAFRLSPPFVCLRAASFTTSSCARLGDINGEEGSWKMTPALVWRQWPVSINAETETYPLIPPDSAFAGHQPLRQAERATITTTGACNSGWEQAGSGYFPGESDTLHTFLFTNESILFLEVLIENNWVHYFLYVAFSYTGISFFSRVQ